MKVSSQPCEDQIQAGAERGKLGLSSNSCPAVVSFQYSTNESHVPQKLF